MKVMRISIFYSIVLIIYQMTERFLIPYKVNDNKTYTDELDLASYDITDDASTYAETVHLRGRGPAEQFAFYVSADVCKKAIGTMNIDVLINQLTYGG